MRGVTRYRADGKTLAPVLPQSAGILRPDLPPPRPGAFPSLSVVLALHGQRALTEACLASLRADVPEAEVILVDNASPDDTLTWATGQAALEAALRFCRWEGRRRTTAGPGSEPLARGLVRFLVGGADSVLDAGCGTARHTRGLPASRKLFVDLEDRGAPDPFVQVDLRELATWVPAGSFAVAVALDVIEHLPKADGLRLLQDLERVAGRVILFTPAGPLWLGKDPGPQGHHSAWLPEELEAFGYRTWLFPEYHHFADGGTHGAFFAWKGEGPEPPETGLALSVLKQAENRGCAGGWNAGLRAARGEVLCVLNNDTLIRPGGLRALAQAAWEQGIAALRGGRFRRDLTFAGPETDPWEADYPEGSALAFRRDVWGAVGPFDADYALGYFEDADWGLRARRLGYHFTFLPETIEHLGGGGATARTVPGLTEAKARNAARFRAKWAGQGIGERIVVRRGGGLGDVIMATPTLAALRAAFPLARLFLDTLLLRVDYFRNLSVLDGLTVTPTDLPQTTRLIVLDGAYEGRHIAGDWRSAVLAFLDRAEVPPVSLAYLAPSTADLDAWAADLLPGSGYVACGLRSEYRSKVNWGEAGWVALARTRRDLTFVLLDPAPDPPLEALGDYAGPSLYREPNVVNLTGRTPGPRHLLAFLRRCRAAVTVDSGTLHVAVSAGLPVVALFASGTPEGTAPLSGQVVTLRGEAPCYPCTYRSRCPREDGPHCLAWVTGERVAAELGRVLEG